MADGKWHQDGRYPHPEGLLVNPLSRKWSSVQPQGNSAKEIEKLWAHLERRFVFHPVSDREEGKVFLLSFKEDASAMKNRDLRSF